MIELAPMGDLVLESIWEAVVGVIVWCKVLDHLHSAWPPGLCYHILNLLLWLADDFTTHPISRSYLRNSERIVKLLQIVNVFEVEGAGVRVFSDGR